MLQVTCSSSAWPAQSGIPLLNAVTSLYSLTHASDDLILANDMPVMIQYLQTTYWEINTQWTTLGESSLTTRYECVLISGCIAVSPVQPNSRAPYGTNGTNSSKGTVCFSHLSPVQSLHTFLASAYGHQHAYEDYTVLHDALLSCIFCCYNNVAFHTGASNLNKQSKTRGAYSDDVVVQTHVQVTNSNYCSQCHNVAQACHSG